MLLARGLHAVGNEAMSHPPCRDVVGAYHAFETDLSSYVHVNLCVRSSHKQSGVCVAGCHLASRLANF